MLLVTRCAVIAALYVFAAPVSAQIYTCTAEDGTRIFSDEKCGPDAKIVPGITTKKRVNKKEAGKPQRVVRSPEELESLLRECNAGEMKACTDWTRGGGPNHLRELEERAELACETGSVADCEQRYCIDGVTAECRRRVLGAAKITGDTWYLREQSPLPRGGVAYRIRCLVEGARTIRDLTVECAGPAGPRRCVSEGGQRFARFDQAAGSGCSK